MARSRSTGCRRGERSRPTGASAGDRRAAAAPGRERPGAGSRCQAAEQRRGAVLPVAAEQLVGALSRERDGDVLRRELGERVEAERRQVGKRLVEIPDELLEVDGIVDEARARARDARCRTRWRRGGRRQARCRPRPRRSRRRTSCTGSSHVPRHQRDDQARVEAAAQHRPERDVAHQPQPHGLVEAVEQPPRLLLGCSSSRERCGRAAGTPSNARFGRRSRPRRADVAGQSFETPRERRPRPRQEAEGQVGVDRLGVELRTRRAPLASRLLSSDANTRRSPRWA